MYHPPIFCQGGAYTLLEFNANVDITSSVEASTSIVFSRAVAEADIEALTASVSTAVMESFTSSCEFLIIILQNQTC